MPKKKTPELDPKEQFKRFQETAKEAGVEEFEAEQTFKNLSRDSRTKTTSNPQSKRR